MKLAIVANDQVRDILKELIESDIPVQASWKVKKMVYKFDEHHTMYLQSRNDLVKKYAAVDADGKQIVNEKNEISVASENMEKWTADMNELLNIEVEMPTVGIKELGNKLDIKPKKLIVLEGLVVD